MRISDWSSDVCSSDLSGIACRASSSAFCAPVKGGRLPGSSWKRTVSASFFFITSSFLSIGFSGRNDMDDLHILAVVVILSDQIGRASCRERVCQYVVIWVVAVSITKNSNHARHILK